MRTVGDTLNRLYTQYLTPPDAEGPMVELSQGISDSDLFLILGRFSIPEDEGLLRAGLLVEVDQELMRIVAYASDTKELIVLRGQEGTKQHPHTAPNFIKIAPTYPRAVAFETVSDNIIGLYPALTQVRTEALSAASGGVYGIEDELAVQIIEVTSGYSDVDLEARIVDFHKDVGGRAVVTRLTGGEIWAKYHRRMAAPRSEAEQLGTLGVEERWVGVILAGAAADLLVGKDIPATHTDWIGSALEAEGIQPGARGSIAIQLQRYRSLLIDRFSKEMSSEYGIQVSMNDPFGKSTRQDFG